jgi:hypothetical protein
VLDDAARPRALRRLVHLLPGRLTFPTTVLCVEEAGRAGAALADGYRDVVVAGDVARAVDAVLGARPPVLLARLRQDLQERFLPRLADTIRARAIEKHALLAQCADLLRAGRHLERRIFRLERLRDRQSLDDVYLLQGKIERFLEVLAERKRPRLGRMPRFPQVAARSTVLGRHEPRYPRTRDEIGECVAWLREGGGLAALGKHAESELLEASERLQAKPLEGLRAMLRIVEREVAERTFRYDAVEADLDPLEALSRDCSEHYGVGVVPPGVAMPEHLRSVLRSGIDPPPDVYAAFCLDLRDLEIKRCSAVMADLLPAAGGREGGAR